MALPRHDSTIVDSLKISNATYHNEILFPIPTTNSNKESYFVPPLKTPNRNPKTTSTIRVNVRKLFYKSWIKLN